MDGNTPTGPGQAPFTEGRTQWAQRKNDEDKSGGGIPPLRNGRRRRCSGRDDRFG
jgi:hypothetical protein